MIHLQITISTFAIIGRNISHGCLAIGILPDCISLPVLISAILGLSIKIPDYINIFVDVLF